MRCPFCSSENTRVVDSRPVEDTNSIRRRRLCDNCGKRFTTYEKIESVPIMVIKKDKSREPFNREKLMNGLLKACEKRPVPTDRLEALTNEIENIIANTMEREITSSEIGELVMDKLKTLDEVAYVRFASVYRQFKDISTFMKELNSLLGDEG